MGAVLQFAQNLVTVECCVCGIVFAVPQGFNDERLKWRHHAGRNTFYCPAGHSQQYLGETEAQRLQRQLDSKQRELDAERRRQEMLRSELKGAKIAAGRARGEASRLKQRARGGLCPCCKRSFTKLQQHMAAKHPDYGKAEP